MIHYNTLSKNDTIWKIDLNNLFVCSLQGLLLLLLNKRDDFANKNEEFYNPSIKKILVTISGMPHQVFAARLQAKDIYPEIKKYFYKENFDVTLEEFLTTKFELCIDTRSSTNNTLHGSSRTVEKSGILLQIEKCLRLVMVILHATCLVLKMRWLILVSPIPAAFYPLKSKALMIVKCLQEV